MRQKKGVRYQDREQKERKTLKRDRGIEKNKF